MNKFENFIKKLQKTAPLGTGSEKDVYSHPQHENRVVGVYKDNEEDYLGEYLATEEYPPARLKHVFYATKLARLLFPENIPDVHMVTGKPPTIERDKIKGREITYKDDAQFKEAERLTTELRKAGFRIDFNPGNFLSDSRGKVIYTDDVYLETDPTYLELFGSKGVQANVSSLLHGEERERASHFLVRMKESNSKET